MKILVADDHLLIVDELIMMIKEILPKSYCIGTAEAGEIWALQEKHRFDIVFLDIELDNMNGITLAKKLLNKYPRTNIIYITGYEKYALESYRTYASAFLLKPIDPVMLKDALEHLRFPVSSITEEMLVSQNSGDSILGKKIQKLREERGMTRTQFAEELGCVMPTIQRWESGTRLPDVPMLMRIAKTLGVNISELFE
ncbi:MAG: response regulator [Clostridia bacterium]|nr:response regulator [Clostridia bacterium]